MLCKVFGSCCCQARGRGLGFGGFGCGFAFRFFWCNGVYSLGFRVRQKKAQFMRWAETENEEAAIGRGV